MRSGPLEGSYDIISPETATQSERVEKQTTVARRCDAIYLKLPRNKSYSLQKVRFGDGNPQIQDHLDVTVSLPKNHPENLTFGASTRFSGSRRVIVTRSRVHSGRPRRSPSTYPPTRFHPRSFLCTARPTRCTPLRLPSPPRPRSCPASSARTGRVLAGTSLWVLTLRVRASHHL